MEYTPFFPESEETNDDDKLEKKKDDKETRRPNILELLQKNSGAEKVGDKKQEKPPKTPENKPEQPEEKKEAADAEVEQESNLAPEEAVIVSEQIVSDRIDEVGAELDAAPENSDAELEATAAAAFLDKIGAKLDKGEALEDDSMEQALAEVADDLAIEVPEDEPTEQGAEEAASEGAEESAPEDSEDDDGTTASTTVPPVPPTPPSTTPPATPPPAGASSAGGSGSGSGSGTPPPSGSAMPSHGPAGPPTPPVGPPAPPLSPPSPGSRFNSAPETQESGHSHLKYVLGGGIVGYLIGKRRGRIKTEAKLIPIQKNLEKKAENLHDQLIEKEQKLRKMVVANKEHLGRVDRSHVKERLNAEKLKRTAKLSTVELAPVVDGIRREPLPASVKEQQIESVITHKAEPTREKVEMSPMSDKQIVEISQKIEIGNSKLIDLYRNGRIGINEMRQVVDAYVAGKSFENLIVKFLKPERQEQDPTELNKEQLTQVENRPEQLVRQENPQIQPDVVAASDSQSSPYSTDQTSQKTPSQKQGIPTSMKVGVGATLVLIVVASAAAIGMWLIGAL